MNAPIYQIFYVQHYNAPESIRTQDAHGNVIFLKEASLQDAIQKDAIFIEVDHVIEYPYASVDYTEIVGEKALERLKRRGKQPRRFCEAALVATPKKKLV